jgi:Arc/MetJ family transcription regulator
MKIKVDVDDELMKKALKYSNLKTNSEVINEALNAYVNIK